MTSSVLMPVRMSAQMPTPQPQPPQTSSPPIQKNKKQPKENVEWLWQYGPPPAEGRETQLVLDQRFRPFLAQYAVWVGNLVQGDLGYSFEYGMPVNQVVGDRMALTIVALVFLIGWQLARGSSLAIQKFGFNFLVTSTWDPVAEQFGALPFIYGTAVSSLIALIIAVPLSLATAIYLTELAPLWLRQPLISLIEMLAAIPSVIYGLWAIFVLVPLLRQYVQPFLARYFGWTGLFEGPPYGIGMLAAGIILAIMWMFTYPVIGETGLGFWEAMRESSRLTEGYRWRLFLLCLACLPIALLGALVLCVGVFVAQAVIFTALGLAFRFLQAKKGVGPPAPA